MSGGCCLHILFGLVSFLQINVLRLFRATLWGNAGWFSEKRLFTCSLSCSFDFMSQFFYCCNYIKCFKRAQILSCLDSCFYTVSVWTWSTATFLRFGLEFSFNQTLRVCLFSFEFVEQIHLEMSPMKVFETWKQHLEDD